MADRVSVMSWLEGLTQDDWRQYHSDSEVQEIARSALALLEEQEARTMTLDELTEIYVEFKGAFLPIRLSNFDLQKIIMSVDDGVCRLWTGKPTYEQMKAVKWNG